MEAAVNPAVVKGREEVAWAQSGEHHQGDGYVSGIWFFVVDDPAALNEGLQLVEWSLGQAIDNIGCGYVVPTEQFARVQVQALRNYLSILPRVLQRLHNLAVLNPEASQALAAPQGRPVVGLLLEQLFEEEIAPVAPARESFWRLHTKLMSAGVPAACQDAIQNLRAFWQGLADAQDIAQDIMATRFSGADGMTQIELENTPSRVPEGIIRTVKAGEMEKLRERIGQALQNMVIMLRPLHAILRDNPDNRARQLVRAVLTAELQRKLTDRKQAQSAVRHLADAASLREHRQELEILERYFAQTHQAQLLASYFVLTTPATLMRALALAQGN